jgi:hypothetical protein
MGHHRIITGSQGHLNETFEVLGEPLFQECFLGNLQSATAARLTNELFTEFSLLLDDPIARPWTELAIAVREHVLAGTPAQHVLGGGVPLSEAVGLNDHRTSLVSHA